MAAAVSPLEALAVFAAGTAAGGINTIVGSGTLITFPTLLAVGYSPLVANVSNNVGLVPGVVSGIVGWRDELEGQRDRLLRIGPASLAGGLLGATLLLVLPDSVFEAVIPLLILLACVLVVFQPRITAWVASKRDEPHPHGGPVLLAGVFLTGVYGGYFGAAQGVILMSLLPIFIADRLPRLNVTKNVLAGLVNGIAALVFIAFADVDWAAAGTVAAGAILGGQLGARLGRRIPAPALRAVIVVVGLTAATVLILR
jgi:uncharacterized membrane protein YfcA